MEEREERFARVVEADAAFADAASQWVAAQQSRRVPRRMRSRKAPLAPGTAPPASLAPLTIPPHSQVRVLLARGELTNAYLVLTVAGGRGAVVRLVYAESPIIDPTWLKGNRDESAGKHIWGQMDEFLPDGGDGCTYTPLWFRAFRYVELRIATAEAPLRLERLACMATGYPLREVARFTAEEKPPKSSLSPFSRCPLSRARACSAPCPFLAALGRRWQPIRPSGWRRPGRSAPAARRTPSRAGRASAAGRALATTTRPWATWAA